MQHLGTLGSCLVRAAKESDSSVATLITTQRQTIEKEGKPRLHKISGKKTAHDQHSRKKRPYPKKEGISQKLASS